MTESSGVWAVVSYDIGWTVHSVHRTVEEAVLAAEDYQAIRFLPYGEDVPDMCNANRKSP